MCVRPTLGLQAGWIFVAVGCAKRPVPPAPPVFSSAEWFARNSSPLTYTNHSGTGFDLKAPQHAIEEVHERCEPIAPPTGAPALELHAVTACHTDHADGTRLTTLHGTHSVGEIHFGQRRDEADWRFHSPKIAAPTRFDIGSTWSARHPSPASGDELRRCDVESTEWCSDGAAITCTTFRTHQVIIVRNHWCPSHGHTGHEGVMVRRGQAPVWSWSSDPRRGEMPLPDLPLARRSLPDFKRLMGIAHALTPERLAELSPEDARISVSP